MHQYKPCQSLPPHSQQASYEAAVTENPDNARQGKSVRAIGVHTKYWRHWAQLTVVFLDNPSTQLREEIQKLATDLVSYINVSFKFVGGTQGNIRIKTNTDIAASEIGTDALLRKKDEPTMYLGCGLDHPDFKSTVLHEFCHALGLHHEHLHPEANIPWNREKVYAFYKKHYDFDKELVDQNVFPPLDSRSTIHIEYDKNSIMHYPVEKELTDGKLEISRNHNLSYKDKYFLLHTYPTGPCPTN